MATGEGRSFMSCWKVSLYGIDWIEWAEHRVWQLPRNLALHVEAPNQGEAFADAIETVQRQFGASVAATEQIEVTPA